MKHNTFFSRFIIIISSIFLFATIFFGAFSLMINYKNFYYAEYEKNAVYENIAERHSITIEESRIYVKDITENIFGYFKGTQDLEHFPADEASHMTDVKFVISAINFVYYSSAILFMICFVVMYRFYRRDKLEFLSRLARIMMYASGAALILLVALFLWSVFSFDSLFTLMHLAFFPQGNWMFDQSSLLITLFPAQFFFDMALRIFVYAIFQAGIFFIVGYWLRKQVNLAIKAK